MKKFIDHMFIQFVCEALSCRSPSEAVYMPWSLLPLSSTNLTISLSGTWVVEEGEFGSAVG